MKQNDHDEALPQGEPHRADEAEGRGAWLWRLYGRCHAWSGPPEYGEPLDTEAREQLERLR